LVGRLPPAVTLAALFLVFAASLPHSSAQAAGNDGRPDQVVLSPRQGLDFSASAGYLSAPVAAPHPFTHMVLRRAAHVPAGAGLTLAVRASPDGARWSDWSTLIDNDDLWTDSDGSDVEWSQMIDVGIAARFWQVRGDFAAAPSGALPELRHIAVNTVDAQGFGSTQGQANPTPARSAAPSVAAIIKPPVVSRVGWGSPDGEGSRVPPAYYPVNRLVQLLAWKAAQKHIDPLGSSYYYGCAISRYCYPSNPGAVVPNIAAHRQVTPGHTSCPGDSLVDLLPGIRNRVKQALDGGASGSDNGDLTIDELESGFARSDAS